MPTPHNNALEGQIAKTVLMPGDPLRAKYIADTFLENVIEFNNVRNMFGYTGTYKERVISVMGSGMGMPSIGIYSYELYKFYGVERIIRIGSAGAYSPDLKLYDTLLVKDAWSESSFAKSQNNETKKTLKASPELNKEIAKKAKKLHIPIVIGRVHSSDVFYAEGENKHEFYFEKHKCIAVEMESFALFHNANVLGKQAACLLTVSDSLVSHEVTTAEERQSAFTNMMKIALELAQKMDV
ncbi:MAG: purine-nucleoside phosphorylase [Candidatus Izemoplasmatales bacterium]|jgi:purine-nucleoside phosphorylase|nr:purine-nucleoside phosphorylase [Candidatus Izemoplasmatales bacterium]